MSSTTNPNKLIVRGKQFHCASVDTAMVTVPYQGGMYTVITDSSHPLYNACAWGDFLVVYENVLYYAIKEIIGDDTVVRLYNVTDTSGDIISTPGDIPGWVVMDLKDVAVEVEEGSFIRWRYNNSGLNKTMDFRVNQVQTLPTISSNIVGQIFWSLCESVDVLIDTNTTHTYDAGVYMCEDNRYVRLDFDGNSPSFLTSRVKSMAVVDDPADDKGNPAGKYLHLYSYYYTDPVTHETKEAVEDNDLNTICRVYAQPWYDHINVNVTDPTLIDKSSEYIPSDLSGLNITGDATRDDYGHMASITILSGVNLRYRWEEI